MYLEKLQEEQKSIRDLADLYQNRLTMEKNAMDAIIIQLQDIFGQNQKHANIKEGKLYKESIQFLLEKE